MDFRAYIDPVLKRWWLIILFLAFGLGASKYYSGLQTPVYVATVTMAINPNAPVQLFPYLGGGGAGGLFSLRDPLASLATGYQQYLQSRTFTTLAVQRLNLRMDPEDFRTVVSTALIRDTNFLRLSVTLPSPAEAQRVANGTVSLLLEQLDDKANSGPKAEVQQLIDYYKPKIEALQRQRDSIDNDPSLNPRDKMQQLGAIDAQLTPMEQLYLQLRSSAGEPVSPAEIAMGGGGGAAAAAAAITSGSQGTADAVTVMDWAVVPTEAEGSGAKKNLAVAGAAALILSVGLAFALEYLDDRVKTPRRVEQALGAGPLAVIGPIPDGARAPGGRRSLFRRRRVWTPTTYSSGGFDRRLVTAVAPLHPTAESFRSARTMVLRHAPDVACPVLLLASWAPGEGKSTTMANLAVAMAQGGLRVAAVDADLRYPSLHRLFDVSNEAGLSAVLAGEGGAERWLQSTAIDGLRVLTAGTSKSSPADILASPRLAAAMQELKRCEDLVLIDGPALSVAADTLELARKVDGVLLVADATRTTSAGLVEARASLDLVGAKFMGGILNRYT
ncbi:MAG: polysaccharide biosynthesis tyrosine autokinase, partial [Chloroflexi bacterium]|nr:polysaccharide biosynthesis tyrosine autokinase [Chloroflexota bacterium]